MDYFNRGTKTGKTYIYADCLIWWHNDMHVWLAKAPNSDDIIASAKGIKPIREAILKAKLAKEGPWAKPRG